MKDNVENCAPVSLEGGQGQIQSSSLARTEGGVVREKVALSPF
jgi:hypothetical protein